MESHSVISPPAHCCQISRLDLSKKVKGTFHGIRRVLLFIKKSNREGGIIFEGQLLRKKKR